MILALILFFFLDEFNSQVQNLFCSFQIFAAHGRWNSAEVKKLIPNAYTLTILRNPIDAFESYYSYMNIDRKLKMDINEFAMALAIRNVRHKPLNHGYISRDATSLNILLK